MPVSRRTLIKTVSYLGVAVPLGVPRLVRAVSPNSVQRHASIGTDGMGWVDINALSRDARLRIVAICDVDTRRQAQAGQKFPDAATYQDWRRLLDAEHKNIDSVNIATPDHMHAPISMSAMAMDKHVYCQKPLTHSVHEARQMRSAAERRKLVTQMGTQGQASIRNRLMVHLIQQGAIGKVREVHVWIPHPGDVYMQGMDRPERIDPVPPSLDWDLWLGVAPSRPFTSVYPPGSPHAGKPVYHPFYWRAWCDFGTGALGDIGCHALDPVVLALNLGPPRTVQSDGPAPNGETYPLWSVVHYTFAPTHRTWDRDLKLTWYNGGPTPSADILPEEDRSLLNPQRGTLFIGDDGWLLSDGSAPRLLPRSRFAAYEYPRMEERDHYLQWTGACQGDGTTTANFSHAGPLTETVLLGNIAMRFKQQELRWDPAAMRLSGATQANDWLRREYRAGWEIQSLN